MVDKVYQDVEEERVAALLKTVAQIREMDLIRDAKEEGRVETKLELLKSALKSVSLENACIILELSMDEAKALLETGKHDQE